MLVVGAVHLHVHMVGWCVVTSGECTPCTTHNTLPSPITPRPPHKHPIFNIRQDFFGGITIFTPAQMLAVNGYGTNYWGWGKEDDNMRLRLLRANMWPPEHPKVKHHKKGYYFMHQPHPKEPEVCVCWWCGGWVEG